MRRVRNQVANKNQTSESSSFSRTPARVCVGACHPVSSLPGNHMIQFPHMVNFSHPIHLGWMRDGQRIHHYPSRSRTRARIVLYWKGSIISLLSIPCHAVHSFPGPLLLPFPPLVRSTYRHHHHVSENMYKAVASFQESKEGLSARLASPSLFASVPDRPFVALSSLGDSVVPETKIICTNSTASQNHQLEEVHKPYGELEIVRNIVR